MFKSKLNKIKKVLLAVISAILCIAVAGCGSGSDNTNTKPQENTDSGTQSTVDEPSRKIKFTMKDGGEFIIKTEPQYAPETCKNFTKLVSEGFYNGLTFHRVIDNFVAQGGDPKGNGTGGSDTKIKGEFAKNGFEQNTLSHTRGVVSMARSQDMNSATSQFFICYDSQTSLDGSYAAFGEVIEGMDVIDGFLKVKRDASGKPETPIVIEKAEIIE